jgi:hypothetical protein
LAPPAEPTYDLAAFKKKVLAGTYSTTAAVLAGLLDLDIDYTDLEACLLDLDEADFYKTMPARSGLGKMQDVYKTTYSGLYIYIKIQDDGIAWVISFKKDQSR